MVVFLNLILTKMKRRRFGKFFELELALDLEIKTSIIKDYRENKLIKYFDIN